MSKGFRGYFDEEPDEKQHRAVRLKAEGILREYRPSFFRLPWLAAGGLALAGVAVLLVLPSRKEAAPPPAFLAFEPAMLEEMELLLHMGALRQMDQPEKSRKRREWPKRRS